MVLHLRDDIPASLLEKASRENHGRYHKAGAHYVYVLDRGCKEVPEALKAYTTDSFAIAEIGQLSSRKYYDALREVAITSDLKIDGKHTLLSAGPCSVENEEQIHQIGAYLKGIGVRLLRAGCFKPRTGPYSFRGLGMEGLHLLSTVRKKYGLSIITEVRDATHVDDIIEHSDIIQIGAKAMYDHGILSACAKSRKPVLLKRGFGSTLDEFIHASEFILCQGNMQVILCERGIRSFESNTRFTLDLCGVAYLKKHTNLPIFIDPSHAMGHAYGIADLARASVAMGVEGLMIEVHPRPKEALSDSAQQLDFATFSALQATLSPVASAIGRKLI